MDKNQRLIILRQMIEESPSDPFPAYAYLLETVDHQVDGGIDAWTRFLDSFPDYLPAYLLAGAALAKREKTEQAIATWQKGLALAALAKDAHATSELKSAIVNAMIED